MSTTKIIYGFHAVSAALQHQPEEIIELFCEKDKAVSSRLADILAMGATLSLNVQPISRTKLEKLVRSAHHQGIAARIKITEEISEKMIFEWLEKDHEKLPLLLILEGIQDPQNVGACLRSAQAFGVDFVIMPKVRTAPLNATVSKVASGALEQLKVVMVSNIVRFVESIQKRGVWVMGTDADATKTISELDLKRPICWVMGAEGAGLKRLTLEACDEVVGIPLQAGMASLNVSVATGICLYETARQKMIKIINK